MKYPGLLPRVALLLVLGSGVASAQFGNEWVSFTEDPSRLAGGTISDPNHEVDFAWGDLNLDGWTDLVVVRKEPFSFPGKRTNKLLLNYAGVLTDVTKALANKSDVPGDEGFLTPTNDRDVVIVDVDLDGWPDVVTATTISVGDPKVLGHPRVYMNLGSDASGWLGLRHEDARFPQLFVHGSGAPVNPNFCGIGVGDVTGDGYPDLYFVDYDSGVAGWFEDPAADLDDRLLVNDGTGHFVDESLLRMDMTMLSSGFGAHAEIHDVNNDGFADVLKNTALVPYYVSVHYNDPKNQGYFNIFDKAHEGFNTYHFDVGDLNNDGRLDMITSEDNLDRYRYNLGNDPLGRVIWGPSKVYQFLAGADDGFASNNLIADLDGDGWNDAIYCDIDLDVPGFGRRIHIYHNPGGEVGSEITLREERQSAGPGGWVGVVGLNESDLRDGHDVAVFDIDNDGDNDMVLGRNPGTYAWMNGTDPAICQEDLGFQGPGTATLSVCGPALAAGKTATLLLESAPAGTSAFLAAGFSTTALPFAGGTIVAFPNILVPFVTDGAGEVSLAVPGGNGPNTLYVQFIVLDAGQPLGWQISNAVEVDFLP